MKNISDDMRWQFDPIANTMRNNFIFGTVSKSNTKTKFGKTLTNKKPSGILPVKEQRGTYDY